MSTRASAVFGPTLTKPVTVCLLMTLPPCLPAEPILAKTCVGSVPVHRLVSSTLCVYEVQDV